VTNRDAPGCHPGKVKLTPASSYVHALRAHLPAEVFAPARSRLLWLPVHLTIIVIGALALARGWVPWAVAPAVSLAIGVAFAGITFLAHETLHGGVVKHRLAKRVVGWIGFSPFVVSPRLWTVWHNREHHAYANQPGRDPDMYPELETYERSRLVRLITDGFSLGARRWTGVLSLMFGFSVQSAQILAAVRRWGWMSRREHALAIAETALGVAMWTTVAILVGPLAFLFVFGVPLVIANVIVMAFILTNHGLSPLTPGVNDPLVNSLSVTLPRPLEWLTLGFGYHVEHHLFPAMSTRHARRVRAELKARWPERYQAMPLPQALRALHTTARVYRDSVTLTDPRTRAVWPTLQPRA
jgi:fatty acid desaturase